MDETIQPEPAEMTNQEYEDFLVGVSRYIEVNGLVQKEVAVKAGRSPVNFSKVLNRHNGCTAKYRKDICDAMGVSEIQMVRLGESVMVPAQPEAPPIFPPAMATDTLPADEAIQALSQVSQSFLKLDAKLKYWMQAFDALPLPVIIVRDGIVFSQNRASRALWSGLGLPLCDGCKDETCREIGCDIKDAIDKGRDVEKYKLIGKDYYKVQTSHFTANAHHYAAVVITKINECWSATEQLDSMRAERMFISSNPYETPEYYSRADRKVSYVNAAFLELFDIKREDIKTADDFHIIMSKKLFYFGHVSKAADDVRENKKPSDVEAKLTNNKMVHFLFRPHLRDDGELAGVMVTVLTPELYELYKEA